VTRDGKGQGRFGVASFQESHSEDLDLLRRSAAGSEEAFLRLFQRWAPRLRRFLIRAGGSKEVGEDLLQEAWIRILKAAPRYQPTGTVGAWMFRICANLAYSHWRRELRARDHLLLDAASLFQGESLGAEMPDRRHWGRAFSRAVEDAVAGLPANHRLVFLLKVGQGLTYGEIAEALECPEGTVKSRFHHALIRLRAELAAWREDAPGDACAPLPRERRSRPGAADAMDAH
jgi:RNA polymerase sigma-70 factor, ECF subfamily